MDSHTKPVIASTAELIRRNVETAKNHVPIDFFEERPDGAPLPTVFIFCCFDPRLDPVKFLGLNEWDAVIIRNVGGNVQSQVKDLIYVDRLLGTFTDVIVIQHTNCGASLMKNSTIKDELRLQKLASEREIDSLELPGFIDLEERVRENVRIIKSSPFVRSELKDRTEGYVFDLKTGRLSKIV